MSRARRFERPDYWILAAIGILCMIGVLMVFSSSGVEEGDPTRLVTRHAMMLGIGTLALLVTMSVPYTRWRRYSVLGIVVAGLLLVAVLVLPPFFADTINGAKRWLSIGNLPFSLQPSELTKLALVVYLADWCSTKGEKVRDLTNGLVPFGIVLGALAGLVFIEPDMGTMLVIFAIGVTIYFVSGAAMSHLIVGFLGAMIAFAIAATAAPYRMQRVLSFLDPWHDPQGVSYHSVQSLLALGSGGWTGMGLGSGRQKYGWLPEQSTDAIFSVWGQEVGFVGAVLMIALFLVVAWRGYRVARLAPDGFSSLLATGITTWIIFQGMLNIGAVSGAVPFTGVPLPFISYGGSSLVILLTGVGILLNISKHANLPVAETRNVGNAASKVLRLEPKAR
ncbi:MAG TPA: putative lipid II flippase FtsW [Chloroflexia bacterium]|jgi:cell division protein FtsW